MLSDAACHLAALSAGLCVAKEGLSLQEEVLHYIRNEFVITLADKPSSQLERPVRVELSHSQQGGPGSPVFRGSRPKAS